MEAPPGIDLNESRVPVAIGSTIFMLSVAFLAVSIRVYTRVLVIRQFGMDDWAAVLSLLLVLACGSAFVWSESNITPSVLRWLLTGQDTKNGHGHHIYALTPEKIMHHMKVFYVIIVLYTSALASIKMTFLFQYYRVFAVQKAKKVFIAAMVLICSWSISQIFVAIFTCTPIPAYWDRSIEGSCIPNYPQWYINAAGNIITDVIIFVLPLPVIGRLNLSRRQKYVLFGIFCLGFFTCIISVIRIRFLKMEEDITWQNVEAGGWTLGELCCGLVCVCLPTYRPFVARFISGFSSGAAKSAKYPQQDYHSRIMAYVKRRRDIELGGDYGSPSHFFTKHSERRTGSSDSKATLNGIANHNPSCSDSSYQGGLPVRGSEEGQDQISHVDKMPSPLRSEEAIETDGTKPNHNAVVETCIEVGLGTRDDKV